MTESGIYCNLKMTTQIKYTGLVQQEGPKKGPKRAPNWKKANETNLNVFGTAVRYFVLVFAKFSFLRVDLVSLLAPTVHHSTENIFIVLCSAV